jgi:hypothetical protein
VGCNVFLCTISHIMEIIGDFPILARVFEYRFRVFKFISDGCYVAFYLYDRGVELMVRDLAVVIVGNLFGVPQPFGTNMRGKPF